MRIPKLRRVLLSLALLLSSATAGWAETSVVSQPQAEVTPPQVDLEALQKDRTHKAGKYPVGARISRYLTAAAEKVDEGEPDEANRLLNKLSPKRLNPYERALVYRMLAYVAYGQQKSEEAIEYFKKVLDEEMLPLRDEVRVRFYIAQLYASMQRWDETITWLDRWLAYSRDPDPLGFYLMGIAYFQKQDLDSAIFYAKKAIESSKEPRESWMRLLAALYTGHEDHENAAAVLEELVLRFPKKQYWVQLSLIYGAHENYRRSLAVQQVAYAQGLLTEDAELRRLARSYLYHDLPYPAARVLEAGLESGGIAPEASSYELLANSWIASREYEKSLEPLRKAAELAEDGNLYIRLGQVYMQRQEWAEASSLLERGIAKGGLKRRSNADLLVGIAYYNDARVGPARAAFRRARKDEATRASANRWLTHLDTETPSPAG